MLFPEGGDRKGQRIAQFLMVIGGVTAAVCGLLTAFIPGLAYVSVHDPFESPPYVEYLPLNLQLHNFTFEMLMSSVGGFLVLGSSIRRSKKLAFLSFAGDFLGILGFLIYTGDRPGTFIWTGYAFKMPWIGLSLTFLGVLLMFASSIIRYK